MPEKVSLSPLNKTLLFAACIIVGGLPLVIRWVPDGTIKFVATLLVVIVYFLATLYLRNKQQNEAYWHLAFAFFTLAFVQLLNGLVPYFALDVLNQGPVSGNPLASTVSGTIIVQLLETFIAAGSVLAFAYLSGKGHSSVYAKKGKMRALFALSLIAFVFIAFIMARHSSRFIPINGVFTFSRFLSLAPALLVLVISNGFQEEFLFRGLFLQRYEAFFSPVFAVVLQAIVFSIAHLGISYTPSAALFTLLFVFPLGIATGYLMRATKGILTPAIFHAALDIPIYLAFLSYVS